MNTLFPLLRRPPLAVAENLGSTNVELANEELGEPNQFAKSMEAKSGRYNERPREISRLGSVLLPPLEMSFPNYILVIINTNLPCNPPFGAMLPSLV